jgi:putative intracellular protease/amidase
LKVLVVLPSEGLWLGDYLPVRDHLTVAGVRVVTASTDGGESRPMAHPDNPGNPVTIDVRLGAGFDAAPYAAVIFCGARADEYAVLNRGAAAARAVLVQMREARKPVAAICLGQMALVGNDVLRRRRAASCELLFQKMPFLTRSPKTGILWEEKPVVVDDRIITAGSSKDAVPFAEAVLRTITPE